MFDQLFQFLSYHAPAFGAFLIILLFVSVLCWAFFAWGRHESNKRWTHDVERMPNVIGQEVRERLERRIIAQAVRIKYLEDRDAAMMPAFKSLTVIAEHFLQGDKQ